MKNLKKIMAVLIAAAMVFAMSIAVYAAPTDTTITVPATDNHTYSVYQIFTGELSDGVLSNVHWGAHGTGTEGEVVPKATLDAVAAITGTDEEKAEQLAAYANLTAATTLTVSKDAALTVPTGYYLIKDTTTPGGGDEATLYILQVVGPTEITRKAGSTTSDKKIAADVNDSDTTDTTANATNVTSADYDIGDPVPYHLSATITEKAAQYDSYKLVFHDVLQSGSFSAISALDIKMNNAAIVETEDYTVSITGQDAATEAGFDVTMVFTPKEGKTLASLANKVVTIDFTATLGEGAKIGSEGNKNTFTLDYSNNPNNNETGTTPPSVVITFTYKVVVDKVDENNQPLTGAGFTLYKVSKADAEAGAPATATDAAAKNTYWASKGIKTWTGTADQAGDTFTMNGIDDGYYVLCETTTPAKYNTVDPQIFVVSATHGGTDGLTLTELNGQKVGTLSTITFTPSTTDGSLTTTIQNNKGTTLPSTGGIGTTIFYIIGGVIVLAAVIILVVRSKKSSAK